MANKPKSNPLTLASGRNESLHRAFTILELIAQENEGISVARLSSTSGLPRSTVSRILASLFDIGAVARPGQERMWVLGPAITRLVKSPHLEEIIRARSRAVLEELVEILGETCMIAIPVSEAAAYVIDEVKSPKLLGIAGDWVGETITSHNSGYVRMLLAELSADKAASILKTDDSLNPDSYDALFEHLETIRQDGYSVMSDELEDGLSGVGVPVRVSGRLQSMLAVYLPSVRFSEEFQDLALKTMQSAASRLGSLSEDLPV